VRAREIDRNLFCLHSAHAFRFFYSPFDRVYGRIRINDHTLSQPARFRFTDTNYV
jgi:hypothetical protein